MNLRLTMFIGVVVLVAAWAAAKALPSSKAPDSLAVQGPNGYERSIIGVCSADDKQVDCWSPSGEPDPVLTERIESYFIDSNNARLKLQFQKFNRLIITQERAAQYTVTPSAYFYADLTVDDLPLQQNDSISWENPTSLHCCWISLSKPKKAVSVTAAERRSLKPLILPMKVGAHAEQDGYSVDVVSIEQNPQVNKSIGQPSWRIKVNTNSKVKALPINDVTFQALDEDGDTLTAVDKKGKPFTASMFVVNGDGFNFGVLRLTDQETIDSRADPSLIASLSVTFTEESKTVVGQLAMFPKRRVKHL